MSCTSNSMSPVRWALVRVCILQSDKQKKNKEMSALCLITKNDIDSSRDREF